METLPEMGYGPATTAEYASVERRALAILQLEKRERLVEGYRVLVALKLPAGRRNCQESLPRPMHQCNGSAGEGPWWMRVHAVGDINELVMSTVTCRFPTSYEFWLLLPILIPNDISYMGKGQFCQERSQNDTMLLSSAIFLLGGFCIYFPKLKSGVMPPQHNKLKYDL